MRRPSWLMSSTTPSATRKSASLVRLQVENAQAMLGRLGFGDLGDVTAFRQGEGLRPATFVLRVERFEAVGVEVVDHIPDPVRTRERHLGDLRHRHALRGQQHHLGPPPGHHRPGSPADDPQQPPALVVINLPDPHALSHAIILDRPVSPGQQPAGTSPQGERCLTRH